ncbi:Signal transduction histidine kinase [Limimonas halophila]|uniref:histidine kinase n=1 Tax=Limimonas halophila TaxID=1082479 RepID=A0A1G7NW17_9PROT|nr:ATP-binding protein [Limimonas halophila]SDF77549.1 Signal transduction histidine kinase [Limimonas halophila]
MARFDPRRALRRLAMPVPRLRSIRANFLAINIPLIVVAMLTLFGLYEYTAYTHARHELQQKLQRILDNQSAVLKESLWTLDHERIRLILTAAGADPDIRGAAVYDNMGNMLAAVGEFDRTRMPHLVASKDIVYERHDERRVIGQFTVALTNKRLEAAAAERLVWASVLAALLLLSAIVSALLANRWVIGIPLQRLLNSIARTEKRGGRQAVQWDSNDEIGAVVKAFNRMQAHQQRYETELRRARDHLERRVAERTAELARARDAAEAANKAKTGFLANMSHELRTPLNAIIGFAEVLENEVMGELGHHRYKDYAKDVRESGQHLLALINDLLDLSKAEAGHLELNEDEVNLGSAVRQSIAMVKPRADNSGVQLTETMPEQTPVLYADQRKLKQILLNLLTNAVKFTESGGEVRVCVDWAGQEPVLSVQDNGIGIAKEDLDRIMQPFAQVDTSMNRKYEGTGLGLPLVNSLVELHGGTMTIDSTPGSGTRVEIRMPTDRVIRYREDQKAAS